MNKEQIEEMARSGCRRSKVYKTCEECIKESEKIFCRKTAKEIIDEIKGIKNKAQNLPKKLTTDKFIYFLNLLMDKIADKYYVEKEQ